MGIVPGKRGERGDMRVTSEGTDWVSRRQRRGRGLERIRRNRKEGRFRRKEQQEVVIY